MGDITFEKKRKTGYFDTSISEDKSKLLIYLSKPYEKNASEKYGFIVLGDDLEELWRKDVELPYLEQNFLIEDYKVNDEGDVYLLGKEYDEGKKGKKVPNYRYHILSYSKKGNKVKDYEISLAGKFIKDITYKIAENGDLICSGLYSENGTYSIKGVFYMAIDFDTKRTKNNSIRELEDKFIVRGWSDRAIRKAKKKEDKKGKAIEMYEYDLTDFVLREDGSAVLIAEQYYLNVVTTSYTDGNGNSRTRTTYHYHYNDIIFANFNANGEVEWMSRIEKDQHTINDGGRESSYVLFVDKDELRILFTESAQIYYTNKELKSFSKKEKE